MPRPAASVISVAESKMPRTRVLPTAPSEASECLLAGASRKPGELRNRSPRAMSLHRGIAPEPRSGSPAVGPELAAIGGAGILASAPRSTPAPVASRSMGFARAPAPAPALGLFGGQFGPNR